MSAANEQELLATIPASVEEPFPLFIRIPAPLEPEDRVKRFDDPLEDTFEWTGLGVIVGGRTMRADADVDENRGVLFCGIDVELYDLVRGVEEIRTDLRRLEAPPGTALEFSLNGEPHALDVWEGAEKAG